MEVLIAYRRQYLCERGSPLNHWDILQNRSLSAARRSGTMDQWVSLPARGLQLQAPTRGLFGDSGPDDVRSRTRKRR